MLYRTSVIKGESDKNHYMWHVWGKRRGEYKVLVGKPKGEKEHLEDLAVNGRIILKCICKRWDEGAGTGFIWLRKGTCEVLFECSNKSSGSTKWRRCSRLTEVWLTSHESLYSVALVNDNTDQLSAIVQVLDFCCKVQIAVLICLLSDNEINGKKKRTQINHASLHIPFIGI